MKVRDLIDAEGIYFGKKENPVNFEPFGMGGGRIVEIDIEIVFSVETFFVLKQTFGDRVERSISVLSGRETLLSS